MRNNLGPTGIALMDIDDFKICNDTYGHHAGDLALETVAKAIRPNIRVTALYLLMGVLLLLAVTLFSGRESMRVTEEYFARTISFVKVQSTSFEKYNDTITAKALRHRSMKLAEQQKREQQQKYHAQLEEQNRKLELAVRHEAAANRAKREFLFNMSHDIRTPMNAIIGFTSLAATHIDNKEQVLDYLKKISISSQHLLSLINDVLDMSPSRAAR